MPAPATRKSWRRGSLRSGMKAEEMRLGPLLAGRKQFVVPYFQRVYSWRSQHWNTLFDDILELYELGPGHTHLLGSMVLLAEGAGEAGTPTLASPTRSTRATWSTRTTTS